MAEEKLNDLSDEIKGTTAVAFFHKETIKLVVDTRESNETIRKPGSKLKVYNFKDKWYQISNYICAIMVGHRNPNYIMQYYINKWAEGKKNDKIKIEVSELADFIETYLKGLASENTVYKFGTIIAGYDSINDLQIYRLYIVDKEVQKQRIHMLASFGSGATYASHRMINDYKFNFSDEEAKIFAQKIIFNASFYDKLTDGNINYLEVTKGVKVKECAQALQAYSDFYNEYDEGCTLFLVYGDKNGLIVTDDLIHLFRKHGDIIVAHNVDHRTAQEKGFYFHRLVFVSKEEADKAWAYVTSQQLVGGYESYLILSRFPYRLDWNNISLWVEKASKELLDYILSNSNIVLDLSPSK